MYSTSVLVLRHFNNTRSNNNHKKSQMISALESAFLFQRLSVLIQRFAVAIQGTFAQTTTEDEF